MEGVTEALWQQELKYNKIVTSENYLCKWAYLYKILLLDRV